MAIHQASMYVSMLDQAKIQQQSVSGVSLDEEMTDMIKFQQAYNAAARVMTAMDEMLNVLISQTGVVGR
jgi:flagellar hook-associated protein 1 FlgK